MSLPNLMEELAKWYIEDPAKCEDFCLKMADGNTYLLDAVRAKAGGGCVSVVCVSTSGIVVYVTKTYGPLMAQRVAEILIAPSNAFSDSVRRSLLREMKEKG